METFFKKETLLSVFQNNHPKRASTYQEWDSGLEKDLVVEWVTESVDLSGVAKVQV